MLNQGSEAELVSWGDIDSCWRAMGSPYTRDDSLQESTPVQDNGEQALFDLPPNNPQVRKIFLGLDDSNL